MRRIAVMNAKGGCGKTTIATNLASFYAAAGLSTALYDFDALGSSMRWLHVRPATRISIHGIKAHKSFHGSMTRTWAMRLPPETQRVIIDTPAGLTGLDLADRVGSADAILVPVLPSPIDIDATADFIRALLTIGAVRQKLVRVAVIANRVKPNTKSFHRLEQFLETVDLPVIAQLQDSQFYVNAMERGMGIHEMFSEQDYIEWTRLTDWLEMKH
jgi:chromosome partitioning protein